MEYADAHDRIDLALDDAKDESTDAADLQALNLVGVGLHALVDIAESLDSLNNHANEGRLSG